MDVEVILQIPFINTNEENKVNLMNNKNGLYNVKSGYYCLKDLKREANI